MGESRRRDTTLAVPFGSTDGIEGYGHVLFTNSEKPANANDEGTDIAVVVHDHIVNLTKARARKSIFRLIFSGIRFTYATTPQTFRIEISRVNIAKVALDVVAKLVTEMRAHGGLQRMVDHRDAKS
jgi:hypothetical protein